MAGLGKLTFEVLVRPKGSTDEPHVVGELTVDLDTKKAETPAPIPPLPDPVPEPLPEFIDLPNTTAKEARDAAAQ